MKKLSLLLCLGLSFLLLACGQKQAVKKTSNKQSPQTSQSSKKTSQTNQSKQETTQSSQNVPASPATATEQTTTEPATTAETPASSAMTQQVEESTPVESPNPASQAASSTVDISALDRGDFSSIAGTWSGSLGTMVIAADGSVTFPASDDSSTIRTFSPQNDGTFHGSIGGQYGGAVFKVIPAGVPDPYYGRVENYDRITAGHGINMFDTPYYRQ